jgi:hypothetical protein
MAPSPAQAPSTVTWFRRTSVLVVVCVGLDRLDALFSASSTDFDDAYMFLRYAHNWLAGFGLRWNRDEAPVYGATSLPQVFVVAFVRWARPRLTDAAVLQLSSGAAAVLLVVALVLTCARFARHPWLHRQRWIWAALLMPLLAYGEAFRFHAQTGMDTMLAALANALLVFAALAFAESPSPRRALATAVVAYGAYLVRPDSAIYALLVPGLCLALGGPPAGRLRPVILFAASLAALVALDLLLKRHFLGTAWPLGAYVKRPGYYAGFAGEYTWNPFWFLRVFLAGLWPFLAALVLFTGRRSARSVVALLAPVLLTVTALFGVNQIMGHLGRFYFPALPFIVVAAALSFDRALAGAAVPSSPPPRVPAGAAPIFARLAGVMVLLIGGAALLTAAGARYEARARTQALAPLGGYVVAAVSPLPELDSWRSSEEMAQLARAAPAGTRLAMSEHGLVGALAPDAVIIDVLGLHDGELARHGFQVAELWRRQPDLIWMPHPDHTAMIREILDSDRLWADYDFYPDAFTYGVALRREGPRAAVLARLFRARWEASYPGRPLDGYRAQRAAPR